jgi:hypothetical protein
MNPTLPGEAGATGRRLDPKFAPLLVPAHLTGAPRRMPPENRR